MVNQFKAKHFEPLGRFPVYPGLLYRRSWYKLTILWPVLYFGFTDFCVVRGS
jgi:hypothetical protein